MQSIKDPILRVVRRGSCIAIDIPPITLTPARTAVEQQLIGEDVVIEPDGWLIASAQTSLRESQEQISQIGFKELQRYYIEKGTLDYYSDSIKIYKSTGLLGESYNGVLLPVPLENLSLIQKTDLLEERKTSIRIALEVNSSRNWLWTYRSKNQSDSIQIIQNQKQSYFNQARLGEWILPSLGVWKKVTRKNDN